MPVDASTLPDACGVYLFKSGDGTVLYVGKSVNISARVRSHLQDRGNPKEMSLREITENIEWIATESELEALVLEDTLIKRYKPRYNIRLKDDKSYPYLVITKGTFPAVNQVRGIDPRRGDHFGPHSDPRSVRRSLRWLRKIFPVRSCGRDMSRISRPCLEYHLGRCMGPCRGDVERDVYMMAVNGLRAFLSGKGEKVVRTLKEGMWSASSERRYETAARIRDIIRGLERMRQGQSVVRVRGRDIDLIGFTEDVSVASVVKVRDGRVIDVVSFNLEDGKETLDPMGGFVSSLYLISDHIPERVILKGINDKPGNREELSRFLSVKRGSKVLVRGPCGEDERSLLEMARKNAGLFSRRMRLEVSREGALLSLKESLGLLNLPVDIEGFDISHLGGTFTVGSMVRFHEGRPVKRFYRRYRIRGIGNDDFSSMKQVVRRRYARIIDHDSPFPDLVLIDGGKGQLRAAMEALSELGVSSIPALVSIAKKEESLYLPGRSDPIILKRTDPGLLLLQAVRDEAHRFAVEYQRSLRKFEPSLLMAVRGLGRKRAERLLREYGSLSELIEAGEDGIAEKCSIPREVAERLIVHLAGLREASSSYPPPLKKEGGG